MELARDPKFLGATVGATSVLHTWRQKSHSSLEVGFPMMDFASSVLVRNFLFRLKLFRESSEVSYLTF